MRPLTFNQAVCVDQVEVTLHQGELDGPFTGITHIYRALENLTLYDGVGFSFLWAVFTCLECNPI